MNRDNQKWTRDQTIVALNLYCKIPFNKVSSHHPLIVETARIIGRSPNSIKMKIGNFGSFDPELKKRGIGGLANTSKLDEEIWNEFNTNWEEGAYESERILAQYAGEDISKGKEDSEEDLIIVKGWEKERLVKTRVNQHFFRQTVLSAYNMTCCITGIAIPELLIASHIIPWSKAPKERVNPRNGLCLNAFHDRAFDKGLLTITTDFKIKISPRILKQPSETVVKWLASFDGKSMTLPERFVPTADILEYHNEHIFQSS